MKKRAPRNRTLTCDDEEIEILAPDLLTLTAPAALARIANRVIHGDTFCVLPLLPAGFTDLLVLDPPYNLAKNYNGHFGPAVARLGVRGGLSSEKLEGAAG